jgi:hypothetical protein
MRKDRYSALLMANMAARQIARTPPPVAYEFYGGFAETIVTGGQNCDTDDGEGDFVSGPDWFIDRMKDVY